MNVFHRDSNIYRLFVGKSFAYSNFPGRIANLKLAAGDGAYREIEKIDFSLMPKEIIYPIIEEIIVKD